MNKKGKKYNGWLVALGITAIILLREAVIILALIGLVIFLAIRSKKK